MPSWTGDPCEEEEEEEMLPSPGLAEDIHLSQGTAGSAELLDDDDDGVLLPGSSQPPPSTEHIPDWWGKPSMCTGEGSG
ncbi:hypothetical protein HGM15179_011859 [Zosterops borbonicus]|uniref:Uncharacterized protein n=1 Tax=Zosterops borbonicus TaxID=364589 RepID=A0A8K1GBS2_9PASS|nr:hypothetical protein HGM15179_011859 [Zosterops borbonicus]